MGKWRLREGSDSLLGGVSETVKNRGGTRTSQNRPAQGHLVCFPGFCFHGLMLAGFHCFLSANLGGTQGFGSELKAAFDILYIFVIGDFSNPYWNVKSFV